MDSQKIESAFAPRPSPFAFPFQKYLMKNYFREFQQIAETGDYAALNNWQIQKPEFFNWTEEVFEEIHLTTQAHKIALTLASESGEVRNFSYRDLADSSNQLL